MTGDLLSRYRQVRKLSERICSPLGAEDYVVQPVAEVSPPKWHLGHTTWFFETFILKRFVPGYTEVASEYSFVFNSYYESLGARVLRTDRGNLSRPSVADVLAYRSKVDEQMESLLSAPHIDGPLRDLVILGLNHEQQHQELLYSDIKYILGHNPLFPSFAAAEPFKTPQRQQPAGVHHVAAGVFEIGFEGDGFSFDNEHKRHKVYLQDYSIHKGLVTNAEYLDFIRDGGYQDFRHWHSEGWDWVRENNITAPLYWHRIHDQWMHYTFDGLQPVASDDPVCHVSFYEASAFASWRQKRLPTEAEWEIASDHFPWGLRWEWTGSAYLPYPGFAKPTGAIGEYNGKFMVNQMVLRGASVATPEGHSRKTYRNFFHAHERWQFTGIRLAG